jgi:hypothetical protein
LRIVHGVTCEKMGCGLSVASGPLSAVSGQLSATARGFGSCHFSIVRREREIICKLK